MAENVLKIPGELDLDTKRAVAEHRRCLLLALLACTPSSSPTMKTILSNGLLVTLKSWLDDILNGAIGEFLVALELYWFAPQLVPSYIALTLAAFSHF